MGKKNKTRSSWLIIGIGIAFAIVTVYLLIFLNWPENVVNCLAVGGTFASLVGIAVTMVQVSSVKKEVSAIRSFHDVADFNEESNRVRLLQYAIPSEDYKFIKWHIGELKSFLVKQKSNPIVKNDNDKFSRIEQIIVNLGMDIENMNKKIENSYMFFIGVR